MTRRAWTDALRRLIGRPRRFPAEFANALLEGTRMVGVDVGGAFGLPPHWQAYHGSVHFYAFEPHPASFEQLKTHYANSEHPDKYVVLSTALSGTGGPRTFYRTNEPTGSSILRPRQDGGGEYVPPSYFFPMTESTIETRTLASVLDERREPRADLIKLDIQGAELEVLQGLGDERLGHLLAAEVEVGLHQAYEGQPTFGEIDEFLRAKGLECFDVRVSRAYRPRDGRQDGYQREIFDVHFNSPTISARAWEFDVVYFRGKESALAENEPATVRKMIVALCGYAFFAEAYDLAEEAERRRIVSRHAGEALRRTIVDWHRALHRRFHDAPRPLYDVWRKFLARRRWGKTSRWSQYLWLDYPNG